MPYLQSLHPVDYITKEAIVRNKNNINIIMLHTIYIDTYITKYLV